MRQNISDLRRRNVIWRAYHCCEYCLVHEDDFYLSGEVDHIQTVKHGGTSEILNLAYSCIHCNRNKGTDEAIVINGKAVRLFNPRTDHWGDHFELSGPVILAKTEIGEATIKVLKMNDERRILERLAYMEKGTYPPADIVHLLDPS